MLCKDYLLLKFHFPCCILPTNAMEVLGRCPDWHHGWKLLRTITGHVTTNRPYLERDTEHACLPAPTWSCGRMHPICQIVDFENLQTAPHTTAFGETAAKVVIVMNEYHEITTENLYLWMTREVRFPAWSGFFSSFPCIFNGSAMKKCIALVPVLLHFESKLIDSTTLYSLKPWCCQHLYHYLSGAKRH